MDTSRQNRPGPRSNSLSSARRDPTSHATSHSHSLTTEFAKTNKLTEIPRSRPELLANIRPSLSIAKDYRPPEYFRVRDSEDIVRSRESSDLKEDEGTEFRLNSSSTLITEVSKATKIKDLLGNKTQDVPHESNSKMSINLDPSRSF